MTDKELKKLSRAELLEMLLQQTQEVDRLKSEIAQLEVRLQQRQLQHETAGNIAQAALQVSGIFEAAQAAADQYLENVSALEAKTQMRCQLMEEQTKEKCKDYVRKAEIDAKKFWEEIREEIRDPYIAHERWMQIESAITGKKYEKLEF